MAFFLADLICNDHKLHPPQLTYQLANPWSHIDAVNLMYVNHLM